VPRKKASSPNEEVVELLRDLLVLQLGVAKVPQNEIRQIVGCSIGRVSDILKHLPKK